MTQLAFDFAPRLSLPCDPSQEGNAAPGTGPLEESRKTFPSPTVRPTRSSKALAAPAVVSGPVSQLLTADAASKSNDSAAWGQPDSGLTVEPDCGVPRSAIVPLAPSGEPSEALIGASGLARRALIDDPAARPETLAGCFGFVTNHAEVPATFRALLPATRKMIARDSGHDLADLPADPAALRPLLVATRPRRRKLSCSRKV